MPKSRPIINHITLPDSTVYLVKLQNAGVQSLYPNLTPSDSIAHYQKKLLKATTPLDRGNAICCLALIAHEMSYLPDHQKAAKDVLKLAVMPNLPLCQPSPHIDALTADCWYEALCTASTIFERLNDDENELLCLDIMIEQAGTADDRSRAVYLKARHFVKRKNYPLAIKTMEQIDPTTKWGKDRDPFIAIWRKNQDAIEAKGS